MLSRTERISTPDQRNPWPVQLLGEGWLPRLSPHRGQSVKSSVLDFAPHRQENVSLCYAPDESRSHNQTI